MANLTLAMRAREAMGEALPVVFTQLHQLQADIRRGQLSLVVAAPGRGKSAISTHIAIHSGVPTLYFSADTDVNTLGVRVAAGLVGRDTVETEELMKSEGGVWDLLTRETKHLSWNFESAPSIDSIFDEMEAYAVVYGEYPHFVVVDNLMNVSPESDKDAQSHDAILDQLQQLARSTGAAVLVLAHANAGPQGKSYEDGYTPIPLSGLMNRIGKRPRLVITLYQVTENILGACVVKNSSGPADPQAKRVVARIGWMPSRSFFVDGRNGADGS